MTRVGMHEAKTQLSKLVARAEGGEEIVITRRGKPAVRLVPAKQGALALNREIDAILSTRPRLRRSDRPRPDRPIRPLGSG